MIDPHVHLRDGSQRAKETLAHGLNVAWKAGLDAVFEMPNTDPPLLDRRTIEKRLALANAAGSRVFHGLYAGLSADPAQIREVLALYSEFFPRLVGFKLFAGKSTGNLSVVAEQQQQLILKTLKAGNYRGVLAVHCEKEACFKPELWNPQNVASHCQVRPPRSELASIRDLVQMAGEVDFRGTLHVCHISTPAGVRELQKQRLTCGFNLTCGVTPHHALLSSELMHSNPLLKMNPPLRSRKLQEELLQYLLEGRIDWIETDHAPHTLADKPLASGIPGLPFLPHFLRKLRELGMSEARLEDLTHTNICRTFGIEIENTRRAGALDLAGEYPFDAFAPYT